MISLQSDGSFPNAPDIVAVHEGFDMYDFDRNIYGQRLTAHLLVCVFLQLTRPGLLEAWLVLTNVKYHGNL